MERDRLLREIVLGRSPWQILDLCSEPSTRACIGLRLNRSIPVNVQHAAELYPSRDDS
jgi:hypothetical protein